MPPGEKQQIIIELLETIKNDF